MRSSATSSQHGASAPPWVCSEIWDIGEAAGPIIAGFLIGGLGYAATSHLPVHAERMTTKLASGSFTAVLVARRSHLLLHCDRVRLHTARRHRIWRCHRDALAGARGADEDTCTGLVGA